MFMKRILTILAVMVVISCIGALPYPTLRGTQWTDPPFSVPVDQLAATVSCPRGVQGKAGGIVFLIHGTGSSAEVSWNNGPYNLILPTYGPGYDICWIDLPGHAVGNAATTAEYVAYNIPQLAAKSATGQVFVIGHSQGAGLTIPWALDFFPSTQKYVAGFIALSGDFHGSIIGNVGCTALQLSMGHCSEAIYQQSIGSQFLRAQNIDAGKALVGTTSIFTLEDEIIAPEPQDSTLAGANNIAIQGLDVCGPLHVADHFLAPFDSGFFGLALDALAHGGIASTSSFDKAYCSGFNGSTLVNASAAAAYLESTFYDLLNIVTASSPYASTSDPPLPEYVCQRYPSGGFNCAQEPLL